LKHLVKILFSVITIILLTSNCAKKGRPDGGKKDSLAPLMVTATPPYKSIHFKSNKIKISFDEYITLKNITQQLVISPPLKYLPTITPQGTPSKSITIKLLDTLKPNTTYTFNFGNSIEDNNEGNKLPRFKYIFSTGSYIDSLKIHGTVKDAFDKEFEKNISVLLYKVDSSYTDSIIYKQKPNYVTNTLDSSLFNITNIQKGKYLLIALKDVSNNYLFNPKEDKIGVYKRFITLPKDSIIESSITLFKETPIFNLARPKELSKGKITFGFEGDKEGMNIEVLSAVPTDFKSISKFEKGKDTLNYWHSKINNDSLKFKVTVKNFIDTVTVYLRSKKIDSLKINSNVTQTLHLKDTLTLVSNNPIIAIDTSKVIFIDKDTIKIPYTNLISKNNNKIQFLFDKKHKTRYKLTLLPQALTDILKTQNDTLNYNFSTKEPDDYGSIILKVNNQSKSPLIVELLTPSKLTLVQRYFTSESKTLNFDLLAPGKYIIRVIIDKNNNGKWDSGNYLRKQVPEKVIYHTDIFDIRSNWHLQDIKITIN